MTARALTTAAAPWWACALLAGCSALGNSKPHEGFTAADRKFFHEAESQMDGTPAPKPGKQTESFLAMGQFYLEVKKTQLAERMFEKAVAADPKSVPAYAGLSKCYVDAGQTDKAAEALNKGFAVAPKSPILWNEAAVLRAKTGDMDGAVQAAEKAVALGPNVTLYAENLGNLLAVTGRYQKAIEIYEKALNPAEAHYRVGLVMRDKGDLRGFNLHLKQALTLNPEHAAARRVLSAANDGAPTRKAPVQAANYETSDDADQQVQPAAAPATRRSVRSSGSQWAR